VTGIVGVLSGASLLLYILCGYPLILHWLARRHAKPIRRARFEPPVTIVIAVHNGERFIENKLRSIFALEYPRDKMTILVASDGSTDSTAQIVERFAKEGVRLLNLPRGGKPAALNAAIAEVTDEILVLTDVRQTLARDSLRLLLENFADPEVGAASAELVILKSGRRTEDTVSLYWRYEVWIRLNQSALDSIFGATGAYYALRRKLAVPIPEDALLDDMYLPLAAFFEGYRLIVDARAKMFDYPTGIESEFRRKVRTLAGNYQILRAYPQLLSSRNRLWFHFLSHKFGRLILPFAMILILTSSLILPSPWRFWALLLQAGFYAAALVDRWLPESALKRLTSPINTFVTLMAAALCAVSIFFVPSNRLWRRTEVSASVSRS
jgi:cellulose synthase/poly-beta-1,6-N-acetylglucosamine synthase-like glycosyltransferase